MKFLLYEIWGSQSDAEEAASLVRCYAESMRYSFVTFQRIVSPPTSMVLSPWRTGLITLEDEGDKILQNAGNHLPSDIAQVPGDRNPHQIFTTALSISFKSKFSNVLCSQILPWSTQTNQLTWNIVKDNFMRTCSVYKGFTNTTVHQLHSESDSFSANQGFPSLLWKGKFYYRGNQSIPTYLSMHHFNPQL
jgi:hypothetical protein